MGLNDILEPVGQVHDSQNFKSRPFHPVDIEVVSHGCSYFTLVCIFQGSSTNINLWVFAYVLITYPFTFSSETTPYSVSTQVYIHACDCQTHKITSVLSGVKFFNVLVYVYRSLYVLLNDCCLLVISKNTICLC